ncbi:MAG: carboxypeptidase regulatory-like domain-containing protein [Pirellulaceae bacterium]|nr:carboxypeptidase regulatory-like domain-containing protein [Pirellulaceae bacterium]
MRALLLLVPLLVIAGCGGGAERPVSAGGKVSFKGKPVEGALVTFMAKGDGRSATAKTEADGTFKLTTVTPNDGALPGEYTVTIAKVEMKNQPQGGVVDINSGDPGAAYSQAMSASASNQMHKLQKDLLPGKYGNAATSGLTQKVTKGEENNFTFDLQ